jgi:GDSL-like Lipase/Acylhydrolase family
MILRIAEDYERLANHSRRRTGPHGTELRPRPDLPSALAGRAAQAGDEVVRSPRLLPQPADLLVIAFGVNDAIAYRSPAAFARDVGALVLAARRQVGDAAVVIAGVAPLRFFPGPPSPLREILDWRCVALQTAVERVSELLPRVVVERFSTPFVPDLFASDGFHPNARPHALWGEEIAALALPLLSAGAQPPRRSVGATAVRGEWHDHRARLNAYRLPRATESEFADDCRRLPPPLECRMRSIAALA